MSDNSKIEWTDATWNPVTGCSVVSPGCTNCYAMGLAGTRLRNHPSRAGLTIDTKAGPVWNGQVRLNEDWLTQPLKWRRPRMIFVCAHGDLFHEAVPDEWIDRVFAVMALSPQHTFQVLTKRAKRMRKYLSAKRSRVVWEQACEIAVEADADVLLCGPMGDPPDGLPGRRVDVGKWPLPNVWLGVSAEDQTRADERVPDLLATPAAVRFVSAEPLLVPIDFSRIKAPADPHAPGEEWFFDALTAGDYYLFDAGRDAVTGKQFWDSGDGPWHERLDWIIVGGESGRDARPMHPDWPRAIRDQCAAAGVAFFFKQFGEFAPDDDAPGAHTAMRRVGKARAGRILDGRTHDDTPQRSA